MKIALLSNNEIKPLTGSAMLAACLGRILKDLHEQRETGMSDRSVEQQIVDVGGTLRRFKNERHHLENAERG